MTAARKATALVTSAPASGRTRHRSRSLRMANPGTYKATPKPLSPHKGNRTPPAVPAGTSQHIPAGRR
ncbi:hypothetical protein [Streptomyces albofaciens]|uniref:hypothetical protein n=1 Tax=Streptomyces albofaciens TaxID=66866 RepID=UPI0012383D7B|nr:hypothetical protein [Streptomyces albofaciens]